jgi:hypothetical protein
LFEAVASSYNILDKLNTSLTIKCRLVEVEVEVYIAKEEVVVVPED